MKKTPLFFIIFLAITFTTRAQINTVRYSMGNEMKIDSLRTFKKDMRFFYTLRDAEGQVLDNPERLIKNVESKSDGVFANILVDAKSKYVITNAFANNQLWLDLTTEWIQMALRMQPDLKIKSPISVSANSGLWPFQMSLNIGDTLSQVNYQFDALWENEPATIALYFTNRKIEGIEELQTSAGKFEVYKITAACTSTITRNGKVKEWLKPSIEILWLDTRYGIIKRESQSTKKKMLWMYYLIGVKE